MKPDPAMTVENEGAAAPERGESIIDYLAVPSPPPVAGEQGCERYPFLWGDGDGWE